MPLGKKIYLTLWLKSDATGTWSAAQFVRVTVAGGLPPLARPHLLHLASRRPSESANSASGVQAGLRNYINHRSQGRHDYVVVGVGANDVRSPSAQAASLLAIDGGQRRGE